MHIHSHSHLLVGRFNSILFLLALITAPAFATQNQMQRTSLQSPLNPRAAIAESFDSKTGNPQTSSNAQARLYVTLINISGKPRQAVLSKTKVELPAGQRVVLQMHPGGTLRVVSNSDTKVDERFTISEQNAAKILVVQ